MRVIKVVRVVNVDRVIRVVRVVRVVQVVRVVSVVKVVSLDDMHPESRRHSSNEVDLTPVSGGNRSI